MRQIEENKLEQKGKRIKLNVTGKEPILNSYFWASGTLRGAIGTRNVEQQGQAIKTVQREDSGSVIPHMGDMSARARTCPLAHAHTLAHTRTLAHAHAHTDSYFLCLIRAYENQVAHIKLKVVVNVLINSVVVWI